MNYVIARESTGFRTILVRRMMKRFLCSYEGKCEDSVLSGSHRPTKLIIPQFIKRNTILLALGQAMTNGSFQLLSILGSLVMFQLSGSIALTGLTYAVAALSGGLATTPAGAAMDTFGRRPILLIGFGLAFTGMVLCGTSIPLGSLLGYMIGISFFGFGNGIIRLVRVAAADMYPIALKGRGVSYVVFAGMFGSLLGPLLISPFEFIAETIGYTRLTLPWFAAACIILIGMVGIILVKPDPKKIAITLAEHYSVNDEQMREKRSHNDAQQPLTKLIRCRTVITALISVSMIHGNMSMIMGIMSIVLTMKSMLLGWIAIVATLHSLGMFIPSYFVGKLSDQYGRKRMLLIGSITSGFAFALTSLYHILLIAAISLLLVGIGWSFSYVSSTTILADVTNPAERGKLTGFSDTISGVTSAAFSTLGGVLVALFGLESVGLVGLTMALLPVPAILLMTERAPGIYGQTRGFRPT